MTQPTYDLVEFRVQDDDGVPGSGTWLALLNAKPTIGTGTGNAFIVCIQTHNSNNKSGVEGFGWEYKLNVGGTWTPLTTTSSVLRAVASANLVDEADASNILTLRSGVFVTINYGENEDGVQSTTFTYTAS